MSNRSQVEIELGARSAFDNQQKNLQEASDILLGKKPVNSEGKAPQDDQPLSWWQGIRARMDYVDQFIIGFLQPGWPGLLAAFILHVLHPWTMAAYIFVGVSALSGVAMMALKTYNDHVSGLGRNMSTIADKLNALKDRIQQLTSQYSQSSMRLVGECLISSTSSYQNVVNVLDERENNVVAPTLTQEEADEINDEMANWMLQSKEALKATKRFRQRTMVQRIANIVLGSITLIGSIGLPFFIFLTINGAATPITAVPLLMEVTATVVGLSSLFGFYKLGVFIDGVYAAQAERKEQYQKLDTAQKGLDQAYQGFRAVFNVSTELDLAYRKDQTSNEIANFTDSVEGVDHLRSPQLKGAASANGTFQIHGQGQLEKLEDDADMTEQTTPISTGKKPLAANGKN